MSTLHTDTPGLVSGGNVRSASAPITPVRNITFRISQITLLVGLLSTVTGTIWGTLYRGYNNWTTHVTSTDTTFVGTLAHTPHFAAPPVGFGAFPFLALGIVILGAAGMELAIPQGKPVKSIYWVLMTLTIALIVAVVSTFLALIIGFVGHFGDRPDGAKVRTDANAWIATHLNLNSPYSVDFDPGYAAEPVFLRSVKPDGSLDRVYRIDNNGTSISINPR